MLKRSFTLGETGSHCFASGASSFYFPFHFMDSYGGMPRAFSIGYSYQSKTIRLKEMGDT